MHVLPIHKDKYSEEVRIQKIIKSAEGHENLPHI